MQTEYDFTAARVLAVGARDAAKRLHAEATVAYEFAPESERSRLASLCDSCDDLIVGCNDSIGAWTTAAELKPPESDCCGDAGDCENAAECAAEPPQKWLLSWSLLGLSGVYEYHEEEVAQRDADYLRGRGYVASVSKSQQQPKVQLQTQPTVDVGVGGGAAVADADADQRLVRIAQRCAELTGSPVAVFKLY